MKRLFLKFAVASLSIVWTCCEALASEGGHGFGQSKKTYAALDDFVEKYVREDLRHSFDGFDDKWGIADVKFSNFTSKIEPCIGVGILEKVTCSVTLIPQKGVRHYIPVAWPIPDDMPDAEELTQKVDKYIASIITVTNLVSREWCEEVNKRAETMRKALGSGLFFNAVKAPIGVPVEDFTEAFSASVYRARDEQGIYHPVKKTKLQFEMVVYKSKLKHAHLWSRNPDNDEDLDDDEDSNDPVVNDVRGPFGYTVVTEKTLRELGGVPSTMEDEVRAIKKAYSVHVRDFAVTFDSLLSLIKEYKGVMEGAYERKHMDEACKARLYPARQEAELVIRKEENRERRAQQELRKCKNEVEQAICMRDRDKKNLAKAEGLHEKAVAALEKARNMVNDSSQKSPRHARQTARRGRNAEDYEAKCRARVESIRQRLEAAEAKIVAAEQNLEVARAERAAAKAALQKTELEQKERIEALSKAITQEVRTAQNAEKARLEAEIKSAAARLDEAWKAIAVPSRPTLLY